MGGANFGGRTLLLTTRSVEADPCKGLLCRGKYPWSFPVNEARCVREQLGFGRNGRERPSAKVATFMRCKMPIDFPEGNHISP